MSSARPFRQTATALFVVPRSMPMITRDFCPLVGLREEGWVAMDIIRACTRSLAGAAASGQSPGRVILSAHRTRGSREAVHLYTRPSQHRCPAGAVFQ